MTPFHGYLAKIVTNFTTRNSAQSQCGWLEFHLQQSVWQVTLRLLVHSVLLLEVVDKNCIMDLGRPQFR